MRFKFFLIMLSLGVVVNATTLNSFFETHKNEILARHITEGNGFVFGIAHARAITSSANSWKNAEKKSILMALDDVIRRSALRNLVWPTSITTTHQRAITEAYMKTLSVEATVRRMQILWQTREHDGYTAVVALPTEEIAKIPMVTFFELREQMLNENFVFEGRLPVDVLIALRATKEKMPKEIDRVPWLPFLQQSHFKTYRLKRLPELAGCYPIGTCEVSHGDCYQQGMQAYQRGDLIGAYDAFLEAAEKSLSYDAFNMAGNVARRIGKNSEAVALLLHAAYLNQSSPHPWVHLAFVAEAGGMLELAENCCCMAEQRNLDNWSKEQIALIRSQIDVLCRENVVETLQ